MPHCARCGGWISALVYECPACGEKPKGPVPRGIIASDIDEVRKKDDLSQPAAEQSPGPFAQAPGPTSETPAPIPERPVRPAVAPRPAAPRPVVPPRTTPPKPAGRPAAPLAPEPDVLPAPDPAADPEDDLEDDIVEVVRKPPEEDVPDLDTPVG